MTDRVWQWSHFWTVGCKHSFLLHCICGQSCSNSNQIWKIFHTQVIYDLFIFLKDKNLFFGHWSSDINQANVRGQYKMYQVKRCCIFAVVWYFLPHKIALNYVPDIDGLKVEISAADLEGRERGLWVLQPSPPPFCCTFLIKLVSFCHFWALQLPFFVQKRYKRGSHFSPFENFPGSVIIMQH